MNAPAEQPLIEQLARLRGVGDAYHDHRGELRHFSLRTKTEILRAMGCPVDDAAALEKELRRLQAAASSADDMAGSSGGQRTAPTSGANTLRCFQPPLLANGARCWGLTVQLYALRSKDNWGIGDFGDLRTLLRLTVLAGGSFVGVNPLHALFPARPQEASPYGASSRHFLNVLYIAVPRVADFGDSDAAQRLVSSPSFAARLAAVRDAPAVNYLAVAALKLAVLRLLFQEFRLRHLERGSARAQSFRLFVDEGGEPLRLHALFDALDASFASADRGAGWLSWPEPYRDPASPAVRAFAEANEERVQFHQYLQWLAQEQLDGAQALARDLGMPVGVYGDFAVGVSAAGSETWSDQRTYRLGAGIGAPPDPLALKGQDWGIPPQDPEALIEAGFEPFSALIRNNTRHYGALRLDHIMALFRQWWVPRGLEASEGGYVHYPLPAMLSALARESQRHSCLVVGEDLGTVPDEMRRAMPQYGIFHYKVMLFEKEHDGQFLAPEDFVRDALATASTHDLPPLRSWWEGSDIVLRDRLGLYPDTAARDRVANERQRDREALLRALWIQGLAPESPRDATGPFTAELARRIHEYLAQGRAALVGLQLEDLILMSEPVNVPGTSSEYANWQRKITLGLEDIFLRHDVRECLRAVSRARV